MLFGSCQDIYGSYGGLGSVYRKREEADVYRLRSGEIEELEQAIWGLIRDGFTWQDAYTQCTLQNLLVAFQRGRPFNPRLCEEALGVRLPGASGAEWAGAANAEIAAVLKELMQAQDATRQSADNYDNLFERDERRIAGPFLTEEEDAAMPTYGLDDQEALDLLGSNKRDEYVQVHKYFDASKGQLKRDPYLAAAMMADDPYNYIAAFPQQELKKEPLGNGLGEGLQDGKGLELPYYPTDLPQDNSVKEENGDFFDLSQDVVSSPEQAQMMDAGMESSMGQSLPISDVPLDALEPAGEYTVCTMVLVTIDV
jgi:hypothetical protein